MQSSFRRFPLYRCIQTSPQSPYARFANGRLRLGLGLSAIAVAYFTWRLTTDGQRLALDEKPNVAAGKQPWKSPTAVPRNTFDTEKALKLDSAPPLPLEIMSVKVGDKKDERTVDTVPVPEKDSPSVSSEFDEPSVGDRRQIPPDPSEPTPARVESERDEEADAEHGEDAFDPVTGEINWDCPCLGGMAHGPCGPAFKEAFSCFVYSEDEPKGINCVEKFQSMQNCFREHPDVYADEIMRDDEDEESASSENGSTTASTPTDRGSTGEVNDNVPETSSSLQHPQKLDSNIPL